MAFALHVHYCATTEATATTTRDALRVFASLQSPHPGMTTYVFWSPDDVSEGEPRLMEFLEIYQDAASFWAHASDPKFLTAFGEGFRPEDKAWSTTCAYGVTTDESDLVRVTCVSYLKAKFPEAMPNSFWGRTGPYVGGSVGASEEVLAAAAATAAGGGAGVAPAGTADVMLRVVFAGTVSEALAPALTLLLAAANSTPGVVTALVGDAPSRDGEATPKRNLILHGESAAVVGDVLATCGLVAALSSVAPGSVRLSVVGEDAARAPLLDVLTAAGLLLPCPGVQPFAGFLRLAR